MARVLGIGDNTVDIYVDQGVQFPGGNAVNVPILMQRMGADAAYLGCVGRDRLGNIVADALVAEGIDVSHLRRIDAPNSWSRIRHIGNDRIFDGNNPSLRDAYDLTEADFAWMAGFNLAHSSIYSKLEDELVRLGAAGPILSFDYSSEYTDEYISATARHIDIAFLSASKGSDADVVSLARSVSRQGPQTVVVTRGAKGAFALEGDRIHEQPVTPTDVVDTLGAGDGFIAGFLMARLTGAALEEQLAAGARHAAEVCRQRGAFGYETPIRPGQPGLDHREK